MAVSFAKVADADRAMGNSSGAAAGFEAAAKLAKELQIPDGKDHDLLNKRVSADTSAGFVNICLPNGGTWRQGCVIFRKGHYSHSEVHFIARVIVRTLKYTLSVAMGICMICYCMRLSPDL